MRIRWHLVYAYLSEREARLPDVLLIRIWSVSCNFQSGIYILSHQKYKSVFLSCPSYNSPIPKCKDAPIRSGNKIAVPVSVSGIPARFLLPVNDVACACVPLIETERNGELLSDYIQITDRFPKVGAAFA
jgi:hypothetical protein